MPMIETVMVCALATVACKQRQTGKQEIFPLANTATLVISYPTNAAFQDLNMTEFIRTDFASIRNVKNISVKPLYNSYSVEIRMSSFDRDSRRRVYSKQRAYYREFPNYEFVFSLIDESSLGNAVA
jgi:hypothetical protein